MLTPKHELLQPRRLSSSGLRRQALSRFRYSGEIRRVAIAPLAPLVMLTELRTNNRIRIIMVRAILSDWRRRKAEAVLEVNNAKFFSYLEAGRVQYLDHLVKSLTDGSAISGRGKGVGMILASVSNSYIVGCPF